MAQTLKIGIRELVDFCCRSGDLGPVGLPGVKALDGLRTHQKIQQRHQASAEAETPVKWCLQLDDFQIELGGRIDLLFLNESPPRIEEIKTVYTQVAGQEEDPLHWAQLQCYGACYAQANQLEAVHLSLNLVNLFSCREQRHTRVYTRDELEAFVRRTLDIYLSWHRLVSAQRRVTRQQAGALAFPFNEFRHQQRGFAATVYRAISNQQRIMIEAPTGSGKTISTLFPAIKAIGEDQCDQVIYLSAKVSGQQQAVKALELMPGTVSCLVLQAKARSCPCQLNQEDIDAEGRCQRCLGFFERLPAAREQLFRAQHLDVSQIQATASEFRLCPFELSLQMLPWVDVVICDFNYVFDPLVQLSYFKTDPRRKLLLIDELHNLVDRARGMYSASISRAQVKSALGTGNSRSIETALKSMQRALDRETRSQPADEVIDGEVPRGLLRACQKFSETLGVDFFGNKHISTETLDLARAVFRFQNIAQLYASHHRTVAQKPIRKRALKLVCLNAFEYLQQCYPLFHSLCGFSATLTPTDYFQQALGLSSDCLSLVLQPVFPPQHLGVCVGDYIDTRYRVRERYIDSLCDSIASCYRVRPGNYLVFFSAYHFMHKVHERFVELYPAVPTLMQQREFDATAQQKFLASFFNNDQQLGFAIMGGRFAEGIDYQGKALIGAIIVGVGLPQASNEQQLIQADFESMQLDGFDYAFRFPGLIRVKQSAGRVIRGEQDRGVVILLDQRFRQPGYAHHLPAQWQLQYCHNVDSLEQSLASFWQRQGD